MIVVSFLIGAFIGTVVTAFVVCATAKEKEQEIYKKGFDAGYHGRWGDDGK